MCRFARGHRLSRSALKAHLFGGITLAGTVTRVRATKVSAGPINGGPLVYAAVENLKTWRLEPSKGETSVEVVYSYVPEDSGAVSKRESIQWIPPNQVLVKAAPHE